MKLEDGKWKDCECLELPTEKGLFVYTPGLNEDKSPEVDEELIALFIADELAEERRLKIAKESSI